MRTNKSLLSVCLILLFSLGCTQSPDLPKQEQTSKEILESQARKTHSQRTKINSPEEELAGFTVPEGFIIELVASERDGIINPIDMTFDDAGRLWTQTAEMYPLDPVADIRWDKLIKLMDDPEAQAQDSNFIRILDLYRGKTKGKDKILVLSNLYNKEPIKATVWADGLALPQSILPYKNGAYVAQGSELFFLSDTNQDGKADTRKPLLTGFGFTDTHTMAHLMVRGPGDWIHFSHGALNKGEVSSLSHQAKARIDYCKIARFSLDTKKIEVVNSGLNNIWGFQLRADGQWYGTEANDLGYSIVPMEVGTGFPGIGSDRLRSYQPWMPTLHEFRVGGTGISGLAFAEDQSGSFPKEWNDVAFLANPITSTINAVSIKRNEDGSVSAEHLPDFLSSKDDWFRPVNMEFGPDGSLYVADWYNKIVSHNELPTTHPDRDKSHGRIWRIRHQSQQARKIPNLYEVASSELVGFLKSPSLWEKRAAWHQISDRPIEETKKLARELVTLAKDNSADEISRILALWSLEGIAHYDKDLIRSLLNAPEESLKREAIRSLISFSLNPNELATILESVASDKNPMIRSQVLRTLSEVGKANAETIQLLVQACKPPLEGNEMGGAYERNFERYLARKALENYPAALFDFINSSKAREQEPSNLIWASQALPKKQREQVFLKLWKSANYTELDEPNLIITANMLSNKAIFKAVQALFEKTDKAETHVSLALKNLSQVQSNELTKILTKPIRSLIQSDDQSLQHLGLDAAGRLNVSNIRDAVIPLIKEDATDKTLQLIIHALKNQAKENKDIFEQLAKNENLNIDLRTSALFILAQSDQISGAKILNAWIPQLHEVEQSKITSVLSRSNEGAGLLIQAFEKAILPASSFDLSSAEKVFNSNKQDSSSIKLYSEVKKQVEATKRAFDSRLNKYLLIAEKRKGNVSNGEKLFQACLSCHRLGDKGYDFAPALDGSGSREDEALLTAILDPDAAVESSYALYRLTKHDGNSIEGYLVKRDERGTSIGFIGGSELFIPANEIKSQAYLGGRSFMMKGLLDHLSDTEVADLLAFIRTLK